MCESKCPDRDQPHTLREMKSVSESVSTCLKNWCVCAHPNHPEGKLNKTGPLEKQWRPNKKITR